MQAYYLLSAVTAAPALTPSSAGFRAYAMDREWDKTTPRIMITSSYYISSFSIVVYYPSPLSSFVHIKWLKSSLKIRELKRRDMYELEVY